jgi:hypothetical protein
MIKSLIILILLVIAVGGAALSKPSQASFNDFYAAQASSGGGLLKGTLESMAAKEYARTFTYKDHIVYSDVSKDGKVVFTGVFAHWFVRDQAAAKPSMPHL